MLITQRYTRITCGFFVYNSSFMHLILLMSQYLAIAVHLAFQSLIKSIKMKLILSYLHTNRNEKYFSNQQNTRGIVAQIGFSTHFSENFRMAAFSSTLASFQSKISQTFCLLY